jgi:UPF0716 family protein affecting phage T7 exclusion
MASQRVRCLATLLLPLLALTSTATSAYGEQQLVSLVVFDAPYYWGNPEYGMLRSILSQLGVKWVGKSAWEFRLFGPEVAAWLSSAGYRLVVVLWARPGNEPGVRALLVKAVEAGVPVLLVPGSAWNATKVLGVAMVREELWGPLNLTVAHHEASGVSLAPCLDAGDALVAGLAPLNVSWASWTPIALYHGRVFAAVGVVNGTRAAIIAPYLYASSCGDTRSLIESIVAWLLGIRLEREEAGYWSSYAVRDLAAVREQLLEELARLNETRSKLVEEVRRLNETVSRLIEQREQLEAELARVEAEAGEHVVAGYELVVAGVLVSLASFISGVLVCRRAGSGGAAG